MARQEYDLELRRYDGQGWRAIFFQSGFEHSLPGLCAARLDCDRRVTTIMPIAEQPASPAKPFR